MIALLLLLQGFNDYNNGFETGTTADWSLETGSGAEAVGGVGSLPPINGGFSGKMKGEATVSVLAVRASAPVGEQDICIDVRILSAGLPSETGTLSMSVAEYGVAAETGVSPSAFSPITVPDTTFNFTTPVITLCLPITVVPGQQLLSIAVSYAIPATETAGPFAMLLDDLRIEPVGGTAFDDCVVHLGAGFAPFRNPAIPADPNDGALHGCRVELHTGSFTFDSFG